MTLKEASVGGESPKTPPPNENTISIKEKIRTVFSSVGVLPILLILGIIIFGTIEPRFLSPDNLVNVLRQSTFLTLVALGQMLVILTAGFDLSVGAVAATTSVVAASIMAPQGAGGSWATVATAMVAGLLVGILCGMINGIGVAYLKVSPLIVTLGTSSAFVGIALLMTGGSPILGISSNFTSTFGSGRLLGIPTVVYITLGVVLVVAFLLTQTRFGRYVYAVGGNDTAARLSGINVNRTLLAVYLGSGLLAAAAGLLLTARVSAGEPNLGGDLALQSITAAVLGGVALRGGEGRISGVILGALFIGMLGNGMNLIRVSSYYQMIALGSLLVLAVVFDRLRSTAAAQRKTHKKG